MHRQPRAVYIRRDLVLRSIQDYSTGRRMARIDSNRSHDWMRDSISREVRHFRQSGDRKSHTSISTRKEVVASECRRAWLGSRLLAFLEYRRFYHREITPNPRAQTGSEDLIQPTNNRRTTFPSIHGLHITLRGEEGAVAAATVYQTHDS